MQSIFEVAQRYGSQSNETNADDEDWLSFGSKPSAILKPNYKPLLTHARRIALDQTWSALEKVFDNVVSNANKKLFEQIQSFAIQCEINPNGKYDSRFDNLVESESEEVEDYADYIQFSDSDSESVPTVTRFNKNGQKKRTNTQEDSEEEEEEELPRRKSLPRLSKKAKVEAAATKKKEEEEDISCEEEEEDDNSIGSSSKKKGISRRSSKVQNKSKQKSSQTKTTKKKTKTTKNKSRKRAASSNSSDSDDENELLDLVGEPQIDETEEDIGVLTVEDALQWSKSTKLSFLPVALVVGGQDSSDNEILLSQIAVKLETINRKRKVVRLNSNQARTPKVLIEALASSLQIKSNKLVVEKIVAFCSSSTRIDSLVVIVDDFESFDAASMRKLVQVLVYARRYSNFPISLIIGVSAVAGEKSLRSLLERDEIRMLRVTTFRPESSFQIFETLFFRLFIKNPSQLTFSRSVLEWFDSRFALEDFSISAFKQHLRYCVLRHFAREPFGFLCLSPKTASSIERPPEEWATDVVENRLHVGKDIGLSVAEMGGLTKGDLIRALAKKETQRRTMPLVVSFLRTLGSKLQFLSETDAMARNFTKLDWMNSSQRSVLSKKISACSKQTLEEIKALAMSVLPERMHRQIASVFQPTLDSATASAAASTESHVDVRKMGPEKRRQVRLLGALSSTKAASGSGASKIGINTDKILEFIDELFMVYLAPKRSIKEPSSFAFIFDRAETLDKAFSMTQLEVVSKALTRPRQLYLPCECCEQKQANVKEEDSLEPSMDDCVIAFKTLRDSSGPASVSLRIWFESFAAVIDCDQKRALARFVRAACELNLLGIWRGDANENAKKLIDFME